MSLWQAGQAELDAEALMRREVPGLAAEGSGAMTERGWGDPAFLCYQNLKCPQ